MAIRKVKLHVHANNASNGILNIKVTPWRIGVKSGDKVEWSIDNNQSEPDNMISWFRVEQIDQEHPWPFDGNPPPDGAYTAMAPTPGGNGTGLVTTQARNGSNPSGTVVRYGLTIAIKDESNRVRIMYIDPDMVIDT